MKNALVVEIHPITDSDIPWMLELIEQHWGSQEIVSRGVIHHVESLPGFVAWHDDERIGLLTYKAVGDEIEIVTLDSMVRRVGIGSALIAHLKRFAAKRVFSRIWLITTNDNTDALAFYQTQGFQLVALHRNAIEQSRLLKPEISLFGHNGIPIRDELELEIVLST